ncbi:MAG: right-handed parallel beta-helix repeat-containing protein [Deltaproteobacteria bacterium]|nr:right-handed parallel beta-helix repeat-containing protein [Deltaproteobacteria bacterium]MBW1905180.1 right-handed parallel beta-helix repeat-containing protein [Deltaproteobacteria bacterium]MBW2160346.1 right-handed parallel beta-helix repeat-containing protein [Deltaproteobacteria bacterium]MBW2380086.1 right-handed parallel beta-helix repeat-containing protein [Deltaproteobacteria bacterium]MBW2686672.1 right-handed parallel beta-helix repeat-containing protein [Deltaproteobacteria bact
MRYLLGFLCVYTLSFVALTGCGSGNNRHNLWTPDQCLMVPDGTECVYFDGLPGVCVAEDCEERCKADADCNDRKDCTADACNTTNGLCSNEAVAEGTQCSGGTCQDGECALAGTVLPCTEQGIRNAIATGGGPYTFACDGTTTVVVEAQIIIDNDVILDGESNLTVDGNDTHRTFSVGIAVKAELRGFTMTRGRASGLGAYQQKTGGGINNAGTLTIRNCTVSDSTTDYGGGIHNSGTLTIIDSTVSNNRAEKNGGGINGGGGTVVLVSSTVTDNSASKGGGIFGITINLVDSTVSNNTAAQGGGMYIVGADEFKLDPATAVNSTVSGNAASTAGGGIYNDIAAQLILTQTTVSDNGAPSASAIFNNGTEPRSQNEASTAPRSHPGPSGPGVITVSRSVISGECATQNPAEWHSNGYNIESPGDTCGFDQGTDQVNVSADDLKLGQLQDNGGPTMTHALGAGSVAIDVIPADMCELTEDQRGEPRPGGTMCDVGAFEVEVQP